MITLDQFVERMCKLGAAHGRRRFPRKQLDRSIMMKSILMQMDSAITYSEAEVNELLIRWGQQIAPAIETDHVTIRRLMVDYGYLERTASGSRYRVGFPPSSVAFELEIDDLDLRATVAAYRDFVARQRAEHRARGG